MYLKATYYLLSTSPAFRIMYYLTYADMSKMQTVLSVS